MAAWEVRRFLEELEDIDGGKTEGGLGRVVFCIFEEKDERAYGEWLPYVLSKIHWNLIQSHKKSNMPFQSSKIFPPTPDDLPAEEGNPAKSETATEEAPAPVSEDTTTTTSESQNKKLKTSTTEAEDLGKDDDWEAVEKPTASEETAAAATDMSEGEGEKVEAVESDGEKVEKPVIDAAGKQMKGGAVQLESNMLAKDW